MFPTPFDNLAEASLTLVSLPCWVASAFCSVNGELGPANLPGGTAILSIVGCW